MRDADASAPGAVVLVGAGPGDPDLITLRGVDALRRADVVVHDSLAATALLNWAPEGAERIDVGKRGHDAPTREQADINALLIDRARAGQTVVRLKGGDPFVYGRGGEEASACRAAGVRVEVVPGVSSAIAAAAAAGIPLTDRRYGASVAIATGHRDRERPWTAVDWERLAVGADTLVVLMGMRNLEKIVTGLVEHGRAPDTPAAVVMEGATPRQRVVVAPLEDLPRAVREAGLHAPAVIVVGDVVRLREELGDAMDSTSTKARGLVAKRVVLTRPARSDDALALRLRDAGAIVQRLPLIEIVGAPPSAEIDAVFGAPADRFDSWFFTSRNAASLAADHLHRLGSSPGQVAAPVLCVGLATAEFARSAGFATARVPEDVEDAETLARAWLRGGSQVGSRALFPCARDAGDALPRVLRQAGVEVVEVVLYHAAPAVPSSDALRDAADADAILFASPSAAHAFCAARGMDSAAIHAVIAAIGSRTARALRDGGLEPDLVAPKPEAVAWVEALEAYFALEDVGPGRSE